MNEPPRLWKDSHAVPALREALNAGRADTGNPRQLAIIAAGLTAAGVPVAQATAAGLGIGAKLAIVAAVAGGLGGVGLVVQSQIPPAQAPSYHRPAPHVVAPSVPEAPKLSAPQDNTVAPKSVAIRAKAAAFVKPSGVTDTHSPLAETLWLEDVRKLLPSQPKQALQRLSAFRARFANPILDQEATFLKVEALVASRQLRTARREYTALIKRHPETPHRRRLEQLLDNPP